MNRRSLVVAALVGCTLAVFFGTQRFLATHLTTSFLNEIVTPDRANDTTKPAAMDPLQMVYLTWAAGDALRHGHALLEDQHQFANTLEVFEPVVLDPLVYVGGALSLVLPLAFAYNLAQVVIPLLLLALGMYALLRRLAIDRSVAFGVALIAPFIPYRLLNSAMGQHNAASVSLLPFYYLALVEAMVGSRPRRWYALAGLALFAIGCSEEHLVVSAVLFSWPFLLAHYWAFAEHPSVSGRWPSLYRWASILASQTWPMLPSLAALACVALVERNHLLYHSIVRHVYTYDVVQMYSVEFNENYFHRTVGYHAILLPLAIVGIIIIVVSAKRRRRENGALDALRVAFALIFVVSAILCLGYVPSVVRVLHVDLYRVLFENLPLFNMQRYPHRLCYAAYLSGLVVVACALDAAVRRLSARIWLQRLGRVALVVACLIAAIDWANRAPKTAFFDIVHDSDARLHDTIRRTAGRHRIVVALPASTGSMWCDSRVLLTAIHTGARFFNGYWSYVPTIYWNLVGSLQRLGDNGALSPDLVSALGRAGIEFVLVDKTAIPPNVLAKLRSYPALRVVYEDYRAAYFSLDEGVNHP